jgi:large subunit ribosomal protein L9
MKVILTADVYKHGVAGEIVQVADGYARNYLIPRGLAVKATQMALKESAELRTTVATRRAALDNTLNELARQIDGVSLAFGRRAGANGKLYGSVTTMEIQEALLEKIGVDINRRRIGQQPIRELGDYDVPVRLGSEFTPYLKISVVREEELADYLASLEAGVVEEMADEAADAPEMAAEKIAALIEEAEASTQTLAAVAEVEDAGEAE